MVASGPQHVDSNTGERAVFIKSGAESGAVDARLAEIIDSWDGLPDGVKADMYNVVAKHRGR